MKHIEHYHCPMCGMDSLIYYGSCSCMGRIEENNTMTKQEYQDAAKKVDPYGDYKDHAVAIQEMLQQNQDHDLSEMPDALMAPRAFWSWFILIPEGWPEGVSKRW